MLSWFLSFPIRTSLAMYIPASFVLTSTGTSLFGWTVFAHATRHTAGFGSIVWPGLTAIPLKNYTPSLFSKYVMIGTARRLLERYCRLLVSNLSISLSVNPTQTISLLSSFELSTKSISLLCALISTKRRVTHSSLIAASPEAFTFTKIECMLTSPVVGNASCRIIL